MTSSDLTNDCNELRAVNNITPLICEPLKKKAKKQTSMGAYFKQIKIVTNKDGSKTQFERQLDPLKEKPTVFDSKLVCKGCHKASFTTLKGLQGHESCCKAALIYELNCSSKAIWSMLNIKLLLVIRVTLKRVITLYY